MAGGNGTEVKVRQPPKVRPKTFAKKAAALGRKARKRVKTQARGMFRAARKGLRKAMKNAARAARKAVKSVKRFGKKALAGMLKSAKPRWKVYLKQRRLNARRALKAQRKAASRSARVGRSKGSFKLAKKAASLMWAWKQIKKLMRKQKIDGRNHGYSGVRKKGLTGFAGR